MIKKEDVHFCHIHSSRYVGTSTVNDDVDDVVNSGSASHGYAVKESKNMQNYAEATAVRMIFMLSKKGSLRATDFDSKASSQSQRTDRFWRFDEWMTCTESTVNGYRSMLSFPLFFYFERVKKWSQLDATVATVCWQLPIRQALFIMSGFGIVFFALPTYFLHSSFSGNSTWHKLWLCMTFYFPCVIFCWHSSR